MTDQPLTTPDDAAGALAFRLGEPTEHRGIVVFPLFPLRDPATRYLPLDHALERGLEITETGADGTVPELTVSNPLDEAVLLYDGEELVGAKQNRILDVSVLVAGRSRLGVPVSCVEQGRWRSVSRTFAAARHVSHAELRRRKAAALGMRPPSRGAAQRDVWDSVHAKLQRLDVASPTGASEDAFVAHRGALQALEAAFPARPGQCGAVLALGDALCLDAVSRPDVFAALWPKLRAGYLLDALERLAGRPTPTERVLGFVDEVAEAPTVRRPSAGLGVDMRLRGPGVLGSGLEHDGEVIQLSAFSVDGEELWTGSVARPSLRRD